MSRRLGVGRLVVVLALLTMAPTTVLWAQFSWTQANTDGFGDPDNWQAVSMAVYNDQLYVGTNNNNDGCEIWRYDGPGVGDWTQVNTDGFGTAANRDAAVMLVYNGNLYVGTRGMAGCEVWRYNGSSWTPVMTGGFGLGDAMERVWSMAVHDGQLWVGTGDWEASSAQVWAYDGANWTQKSNTGFGNIGNTHVRSMAVYNGSLYAGTYNEDEGCELWRYDGPQASDWTGIADGGFDDVDNGGVRSMTVYSGRLILGTVHWSRLQVWSYNGSSLTQIDPGTMDKQVARTMVVHPGDNTLYVGTGSNPGGAEVWQWNGSQWLQVNSDGFGAPANAAAHIIAVFDHSLWVGTGKDDETVARVWRTNWVFLDGFETGDTSRW